MPTPSSLAQIKTDLGSEHQETRGRAAQSLLKRAKEDSGVHAAALPLFQTMLATAPDSWTVTTAARGVELIRGASEGRHVWLALMHHPSDQIAAGAILSVDASAYASELVQLLATRPEIRIHIAVIRSLGRTKNPQFFSTILPYLNQPEICTHAIMALEELEDPRALSSLEPLIQNDADSGTTDDRGWPLRIGDLAAGATRRLQHVSGKKYPQSAKPVAEKHSVSPPATTLPPASPFVGPPAVSSAYKFPLQLNFIAYLPLAAALIEIPWVAILLFMQLFLTGAIGRTRTQTHFLDALALIPPVIGLAAALYFAARFHPKRLAETICLILGTVLCGLIAFSFGWELFH